MLPGNGQKRKRRDSDERMGCGTCLKRKVMCDGKAPKCGGCSDLKFVCSSNEPAPYSDCVGFTVPPQNIDRNLLHKFADSKDRPCVVIHPGSTTIRVGLSSTPYPTAVPAVFARRVKAVPTPVVPRALSAKEEEQQDEGMHALNGDLLALRQLSSASRHRVPPDTLSGEPRGTYPPQLIPEHHDDWDWTETAHMPDLLFGDEALHLSPDAPYRLVRPFKHGYLHQPAGMTLMEMQRDLTVMLAHALECAQVYEEAYGAYQAVLVVPDMFDRRDLSVLVETLLDPRMIGVAAVLVYQEAVCATFGAGVSAACVLDIGAQKTSVACVDDGRVIAKSRISLCFGGDDLDAFLLSRLKDGTWPQYEDEAEEEEGRTETVRLAPFIRVSGIPGADSAPQARMVARSLKEKMCHLDLSDTTPKTADFRVRRRNCPVQQWTVRAGDSSVQTPLALFHPTALVPVGRYIPKADDPLDIFDASFLADTKEKKDAKDKQKKGKKGKSSEKKVEVEDDPEKGVRDMEKGVRDVLMGLDEAVFASISTIGRAETRKRMYSTVLVCGGGSQFRGFDVVLQDRLYARVQQKLFEDALEGDGGAEDAITQATAAPPSQKGKGGKGKDAHAEDKTRITVAVLSKPKDIDPHCLTWKGAAVLASMPSTDSMYIDQKEWFGGQALALRIRTPFMW